MLALNIEVPYYRIPVFRKKNIGELVFANLSADCPHICTLDLPARHYFSVLRDRRTKISRYGELKDRCFAVLGYSTECHGCALSTQMHVNSNDRSKKRNRCPDLHFFERPDVGSSLRVKTYSPGSVWLIVSQINNKNFLFGSVHLIWYVERFDGGWVLYSE